MPSIFEMLASNPVTAPRRSYQKVRGAWCEVIEGQFARSERALRPDELSRLNIVGG